MAYEKIGVIESISDIEFNENIIVNGSVDRTGWMWHMEGRFEKRGNEIIFVNEIGVTTKVKEGEIGLTVLKKV